MPGVDLSVLEDHPIARYCGAVSPGDVPEIIRQHDLLLLPTYWESEGYPGVILEAMQCGRPVIATRWAGIPEVVEEEHQRALGRASIFCVFERCNRTCNAQSGALQAALRGR